MKNPCLIQSAVSIALATLVAIQAPPALAATGKVNPGPVEPIPLDNSRSVFTGEPFFLLSDATFGSQDLATVRLEVNSPSELEQVGGIEMRVYRIPDPIAFLGKQKNLHRVKLDAPMATSELSNTLTHVWDNWAVKSRLTWQKVFSPGARQAVTQQAPELKTPKTLKAASRFEEPAQFKPIPGLKVVDQFRYPVHAAQPIKPLKGVSLEGSSSEFISPSQGNVFVPVGKREPGLYLVEAVAGQHRATTLLFVSDTVAMTKVSEGQMLVWSANRGNGAPVPQTRVVWTDGVGVLKSGQADAQGLVKMDRKSPEQTYVYGEDPKGGVFISENFYYNSEIYAAKVYTVTDRPLYRPGDWVEVKISGREFKSARESVPLKDGSAVLTVLDPSGQVIQTLNTKFSGSKGLDTRFSLPTNAPAGGYEIRLAMGDDAYAAAFRVADYQKPHFEIGLVPDKADFTTGEKVTGKLQLSYPDGKPVAKAKISLTARAQKLTMVDGELDYSGQFPLKLTQQELETDSKGVATFSLPAADQPSRYILSALATDGAAYRVRASKEILVERSGGSYKLAADRQFSLAAEAVKFTFSPAQRALANGGAINDMVRPASWEWTRLENRKTDSGKLAATGDSMTLKFPEPGSYTVRLRDDKGRIMGAASHWVSGDGLKAPAGSIGMVFNRANYRTGDTAELLVTFPVPIDNALVSLERDSVEATALLGQKTDWVRSERVAPTQWKLWLKVTEAMAPNVTVSVAYVKNGDYVFQNQGLLVEQPRVAVSFKPEKAVYAPGETVNIDVQTTLGGQPVPADVTVSVVDEMIYVLQPEIAPSIDEFFYHPRRNNVRTSASLSFIGYDLATRKLGELPSKSQVNQRAVKVLERPRRENVDTAAWVPSLSTDASGHAKVSFKMPDSLTRWRITGRAMDAGGHVGQQVGWVRSDKSFYVKWTSPNWQRAGDSAQASVAVFNQTGQAAKIDWEANGSGVDKKGSLSVNPGANFISLNLPADKAGSGQVSITLKQGEQVIDRLETPVQRLPVGWRAAREQSIDLSRGAASLKLPPDATRVRVAFAQDAAAGEFNRWMDSLIDFPYGCVEQTASRMLPLSIALQSLSPTQQSLAPVLGQRLSTARLSLAQMAGPQARFGWWGRGMTADAFLTSYAYYADWRATQALRSNLPVEHWQRLLEIYAKESETMNPLQRALALSWMQEMGLPVTPMVGALIEQLQAQANLGADASALNKHRGSLVFVDDKSVDTRDMAMVLAMHTASLTQLSVSTEQRDSANAAAARLATVDSPLVQSLLMLTKRVGTDKTPAILGRVSTDVPTFDRAQTLIWVQRALNGRPQANADLPSMPAPWVRSKGSTSDGVWDWPAGMPLPESINLPSGAKAAWAFVSYESSEAQSPTLPVSIERTLWRVVPTKPEKAKPGSEQEAAPADGMLNAVLEKVAPGTPLDSNTLYLDEIKVSTQRDLRWALMEAALPPGAAVEASTWGINLSDGKEAKPMEAAKHESNAQGYAVPIEQLKAGESLSIRHLLRFSQRGQFKLPSARVHRMYEPEAKGIEAGNKWATVEVR